MGKIIKKRIEYGGSSNSAENIKYDDTKNVKEAINEVKSAIADVNSNLPYLKVSPVTDSNGNQLPPSSFHDSALSIGYSHDSYFGLGVGAYIPIITMRWYDSSENIRTIQHALSGITTYTRYSVSPTEWSNWTMGATQSQIDSINSSLSKKVDYVDSINITEDTNFNSLSLLMAQKSYCSIWLCNNNAIDSTVPNGLFAVFQYSAGTSYIAQMIMSYFGDIKFRSRSTDVWSEWKNLV